MPNETTIRNRPTSEPAACACTRCGCNFVGEKWNILCRVCVEMTAREIAQEQQA